MEKQDFLPRMTPHGGEGLRDLPPAATPAPCMELPSADPPQEHCGHNCCHGHEGCGDGSWGLSEYPLAMVYAPCQSFRALYDTATALDRGTLFTELDLPLGGEGGFTTEGCACRAERRRI